MSKPTLDTHPCPRCGYRTRGLPCEGCGLVRPSVELDSLKSRGGFLLGLRAMWVGARLVRRTPGALRRLAIPALLTAAFALWLHQAWVSPWIGSLFDHLAPEAVARRPEGWLRTALAFLSGSIFVSLLAHASQLVALVLTAWLAFGFVFEAIAGPFLDTLHARIERDWFGLDAMDRANPNQTRLGVVGGELHMLGLSVAAACLAALASVCALPLLLVPVVGTPLYLAFGGVALSLGALDTAFARRRWTMGQRLRLLSHHWPCTLSFGALAGALMGMPFVGPLAVVPCASLGGLWMLIQLDKRFSGDAAGQPIPHSSES